MVKELQDVDYPNSRGTADHRDYRRGGFASEKEVNLQCRRVVLVKQGMTTALVRFRSRSICQIICVSSTIKTILQAIQSMRKRG